MSRSSACLPQESSQSSNCIPLKLKVKPEDKIINKATFIRIGHESCMLRHVWPTCDPISSPGVQHFHQRLLWWTCQKLPSSVGGCRQNLRSIRWIDFWTTVSSQIHFPLCLCFLAAQKGPGFWEAMRSMSTKACWMTWTSWSHFDAKRCSEYATAFKIRLSI